jgi:hypothetical protein
MKYIRIWLFLFPLFFLSCESLDFYGDTFYTVKGKIIDENDQSIPNFDLTIYTSKNNYGLYLYGNFEEIISGSGKTNQNGEFIITFPKSNGSNFLILEDGYQIIDSVNAKAENSNMARLQINNFKDYLLDLKTIKTSK